MSDQDKDIVKQAIKEKMDEWAASFGWSVLKWLGGIFALGLTYLYFKLNGGPL